MPGVEAVTQDLMNVFPGFAFIPELLIPMFENAFKEIFILICIHAGVEEPHKCYE